MGIKQFYEQQGEERDNIRDIKVRIEKEAKKKELDFDLEKDIQKEVINAFERYITSTEAPTDDRKIENIAALIILAPEKTEAIRERYSKFVERYLPSLENLVKERNWTIFFRLLWYLNIVRGKVDITAFKSEIEKLKRVHSVPTIGWLCLKLFYPSIERGIKYQESEKENIVSFAEVFWEALGVDSNSAKHCYEDMMVLNFLSHKEFQKWIKPRLPKMKRWLSDFNDAFKRGSVWKPSFESFAMIASTMRILAADKVQGTDEGLRIIDNEEKFQGEEREPRPVHRAF